MRKISFLLLAISAMFVMSCANDPVVSLNQESSALSQDIDMSDFYLVTEEEAVSAKTQMGHSRQCHTMHVLNRQLNENPELRDKMYNVEQHTRALMATYAAKPGKGNGGGGNNGGSDGGTGGGDTGYQGTVNIPVHVHVVYSNSNENISDSQINSQISVLNNDFNDTNYGDIPSEFQGLAADIDITFTLAQVDRHANSRTSWGTTDAVKSAYPPVADHLTIWVCNIGGGILGYAQFPGGSASTDGVVISPQYFGTTGYVAAPFDKGRTATHEVGHWLNLRHIWGDGRCKQDDFVSDTPSSDGPNYGCPSYPTVNCRSNDMTMNYMDYTDDACMNMFSQGQKDRMRALFAAGGVRENLVQ